MTDNQTDKLVIDREKCLVSGLVISKSWKIRQLNITACHFRRGIYRNTYPALSAVQESYNELQRFVMGYKPLPGKHFDHQTFHDLLMPWASSNTGMIVSCNSDDWLGKRILVYPWPYLLCELSFVPVAFVVLPVLETLACGLDSPHYRADHITPLDPRPTFSCISGLCVLPLRRYPSEGLAATLTLS